jgi:hypothetical protein
MKVSDIVKKYGSYICEFVSYYNGRFEYAIEEVGVQVFVSDTDKPYLVPIMSLSEIDKEATITTFRFPDGSYITPDGSYITPDGSYITEELDKTI